jgi:hypothetical protein
MSALHNRGGSAIPIVASEALINVRVNSNEAPVLELSTRHQRQIRLGRYAEDPRLPHNEAETGRELQKLLVKHSHVLACAPGERLLERPSAPLVEPERKVCADPGVGD